MLYLQYYIYPRVKKNEYQIEFYPAIIILPLSLKQHKFGVDSAYFMLSAMNYDTLKSLGEEYFGDASEEGVAKSNIFNEYLGNTGTVASAMVIKDFLMQKKFRNDRDGGRVLTSMPYSIRRPNKQLVQEYEQLLNWQGILIYSNSMT